MSLNDSETGLKAFIAIHSRKLGIGHGGTRLKSYNNDEEAMQDVLELSRAMSYKSAMAGLPYGGAKAVIVNTPKLNRQAVLKSFAEKVESLNGLFHTGTDVGLTDVDVSYMKRFCKYMLGVGDHKQADLTTSTAAAKGVYLGIKSSAKHLYGTDSLKGKIIGVKGLGKLGYELSNLLNKDGANLVVADIDESKVAKLKSFISDVTVVPYKTIASEQLDIYAPCALGHEFTPDNVGELKCGIIAGGANNQLLSEEVGDKMFELGILYAPDFVINAGGLIFVCEELEVEDFDINRVNRRLNHIPDVLSEIYKISELKKVATNRVALELAQEKISRGKSRAY